MNGAYQLAHHDHGLMDRDNRAYHRPRVKLINSLLGQFQIQRILDIGCSHGTLIDNDIIQTNDVMGVDISEEGYHALDNGYVLVKVCDIEEVGLPFPDLHLDVVLAGEVIEHIIDVHFFVDEIRRVLRPGGTAIISTPNHRTIQNLLLLAFANTLTDSAATYSSAHVRDWTTRLLRRVFEQHGFKCTSMMGAYFSGWLPWVGGFSFGPTVARYLPSISSDIVAVFQNQ